MRKLRQQQLKNSSLRKMSHISYLYAITEPASSRDFTCMCFRQCAWRYALSILLSHIHHIHEQKATYKHINKMQANYNELVASAAYLYNWLRLPYDYVFIFENIFYRNSYAERHLEMVILPIIERRGNYFIFTETF